MDPCLRRTMDSLILDFVSSILGLYPLLTLILFPPSIASILAILHQKYPKFDFCSYKLNMKIVLSQSPKQQEYGSRQNSHLTGYSIHYGATLAQY